MSKELINLSNLQRFLSKLNEKFALKKAMKGITEDSEGNIIIGEEGLVPTPNENSKGKFLRSDGEWALPSVTTVYDSMTLEEGVAGVSKVDRVINAKNLKQIVNSDGFLTSLDSSKLTGIINIENLPQGALERILIVSSKEERLTLSDSEVQLGDVVKESDTGLMYYVINTEKLNSEEGYTQFTAGSASSVPWSGITGKPLIPTKTSELTNDSDFAVDSDVVHTSGNETINGIKMFTDDIRKKNSTLDLQVNPSLDQFNNFLFTDKNNAVMGYLEHLQTTTGVNAMGLYARDKNNGSHGFQVTSENNVIPIGDNKYNLGVPSNKWENVYATTFYGDLKGNADNGVDSSGANYIKFKDGIQICFGANKGGDIVTFAKPFAFTPYISFGYNITTDIDRVIHGQAKFSSSTSFTMQVWDFNSNTWANDRTTEWIAIGRWK